MNFLYGQLKTPKDTLPIHLPYRFETLTASKSYCSEDDHKVVWCIIKYTHLSSLVLYLTIYHWLYFIIYNKEAIFGKYFRKYSGLREN